MEMFAILLLALAVSGSVFTDVKSDKIVTVDSQEPKIVKTGEFRRGTTPNDDTNIAPRNEMVDKSTRIPLELNQGKTVDAVKVLVEKPSGGKTIASVMTEAAAAVEPSADSRANPRTGSSEEFKIPAITRYEPPTSQEFEMSTASQTETSPRPLLASLDIKMSGKDENEYSGTLAAESKSATISVLNDLPVVLKSKILMTDKAEEKVIESYAQSHSVPVEVLSGNKTPREEETELFKRILVQSERYATQLVHAFKALSNGKIWNYTKVVGVQLREFFHHPSAAFKDFEAIKAKELKLTDNVPINHNQSEESPDYLGTLPVSPTNQTLSDESSSYLRTLQESKSLWLSVLNKLPESLQNEILQTDEAESRVLESYAKSQKEAVSLYAGSKKKERDRLRELLAQGGTAAATKILATYKLLRKGVAWNYQKIDERFRAFFEHPSAALTAYKALKLDELKSLDSFLDGGNSTSSRRTNEGPRASVKDKEKGIWEDGRVTAGAEMNKKVRLGIYRKKRTEMAGTEDEVMAKDLKQKPNKTQNESFHRNSDLLSLDIQIYFAAHLIIVTTILVACLRQLAEWIAKRKRVRKSDSLSSNDDRSEIVIRIEH